TLSRDGKKILLTGGRAAGFQIWNLESGKKVCAIDLSTRDGGVRIGAFSPDGKLLAVGGTNHPHAASFWDTTTGERVEKLAGHRSPISVVAFSPDGAEVATCSALRSDPIVRIWDPKTGRLLRAFEAHPLGVDRLAYTPDGMRLITCGMWSKTDVCV